MIISTKNNGFTLIEVLVYITLVSIMVIVSISTVFTLINNSDGLNQRVVIEDEANFILNKIEWSLGSVNAIISPAPGANGSALILTRHNFPSNPIAFDLNNENIRMSVAGGSPEILNSDLVSISNLNFVHIAQSGESPEGVTASFSANGRNFSMTIYKNK